MKKYAKKRTLSSLLAVTMLMSSMSYNNVTIFADDVVEEADAVVSGEAVTADSSSSDAAETMVEDYLEAVGDKTDYGTVVDNMIFMSDAAVEADTLIFENDYAKVYAGQKLQFDPANDDLIAAGKNPADLTFGDVAFTSKVRTSGVNTKAKQTNDASDPATNLGTFKLSSNHRVAYKVVSKQACKITAYASGGNHVLFLDSGTADSPNVTLGSTNVEQGPATILGGIAGTGSVSADIEGNQVAYFSGQGTNDNFLGIKVEAGSKAITPEITFTLDGEAVTEPVEVAGSGFKYVPGSLYTGSSGGYVFDGLATYDYTFTVVKDGVTYQGTFKADADGTYNSTVNLEVIAADAGLYIKDSNGNPIKDACVVLDHYQGYTPKKEKVLTDENGLAKFNLVFGDYSVTVPGYTLDKDTYSPSKGALTDTITATKATLPAIPAEYKDHPNVKFVGFEPEEGCTVYSFLQEAVDAAVEGDVVLVAPGEYYEPITITKSMALVGYGDEKPVICYDDNQQGNDDNNKTRFHGDTLAIRAENAEVILSNLVIGNYAEANIPGVVQNATALSSCYDKSANTITVSDCDIVATRDTIYTGKSNCTDQWTFNGCNIYGFQDVVCGGGNVEMNDCQWVINMDSDARFLVPQCRTDGLVTVMEANDLDIVLADKFVAKQTGGYTDAAWNSKAYLGRAWGNGSAPASSTQCIVNSYTDDNGLIEGGVLNGYDSSEASATPDTIKTADWLVGVDVENKVYLSTRWANINKFNSELSGSEVRGSYQLIGDFNEEYKETLDGVGFAIFDMDNNYIGTATSKSVYQIKGSTNAQAYSVSYIDNVPDKFKVRSAAVTTNGDIYILNSNNATVTVG